VLEVRREDAARDEAPASWPHFPVADLSIEDPPIEEVIRLAFRPQGGGGRVIELTRR